MITNWAHVELRWRIKDKEESWKTIVEKVPSVKVTRRPKHNRSCANLG